MNPLAFPLAAPRLQAFGLVRPGVVRSGRMAAPLALDAQAWDPGAQGADWFDGAALLPGVKQRYLNDAVRFALAAARQCERVQASTVSAGQRGLMLGSAGADFSVRAAFDRVVLAEGAAALSSVSAPNISANIAAAHVAMACQARAFATTLSAPLLASLEGLYLGVRALQQGRCAELLLLAAEESLPADSGAVLLPGALALRVGRHAQGAGPSVTALAWGRCADCPPSALTQGLAALPRELRARLLLLRDDSALAEASAGLALQACAATPLFSLAAEERVLHRAGALEPLLHALHWLTVSEPVVLLAIQGRRYLAFLFHPHP